MPPIPEHLKGRYIPENQTENPATEKFILKLHLNNLGKRALNAEIKTFYVDATRDEIDPEFVDKLFPKDLVEKIEVVRSFASYADGERLVCIKDGERLLAEAINWNPYDKSLLVKVYEEGEEHFYSFHLLTLPHVFRSPI